MCHSIEHRDRRYVKGYGFLSFARNIGKNIAKSISNKYTQKLVDSAIKSGQLKHNKDSFKKSNSKNSRSGKIFGWQ